MNLESRVAADARDAPARSYSVGEAVRFVVSRGLDEQQLREGSMPEPSLEYAGALLGDGLPRQRPLFALHVGNFVGVSLSYFTWLLREQHPESVVVSIDPNIRHRGIENPQDHVLALLGHFGLLANSLVVPGYTLEQNFGDWWSDELEDRHRSEAACDRVLASLARLSGRRFDLAVLDGNHDGGYLAREFAVVREVLADDSIVVFDDVGTDPWLGVSDVFKRALGADPRSFEELGQDGRIGVLRVRREGELA